jgi:septal ring factor EnvC (AmiA/AmiB activator)
LALTDGQIIALITIVPTSITATGAWLANRYGKRVDREATRETRQTAVETNLLQQSTECFKRLDALQLQLSNIETAHRLEMANALRERYESERQLRADISKMEDEINDLRAANIELQHENWKLKQEIIVLQGKDGDPPLPKEGKK